MSSIHLSCESALYLCGRGGVWVMGAEKEEGIRRRIWRKWQENFKWWFFGFFLVWQSVSPSLLMQVSTDLCHLP